ncbi:hypothetical protein KY341_06005 [Candidatus Woesearchaeota archaeon]|nr:hypothetical protein [Candidatus Woesearchaeota archaeon]
MNDLDEKLRRKKISKRKYNSMLKKEYRGKNKEELMKKINGEKAELKEQIRKHRMTKNQIGIAGIILLILVTISILTQPPPSTPTGLVIGPKLITQTLDYNQGFEQYTETVLDITNITSLRISGKLEGTKARIKLRIDGNEYVIAHIINEQEGNLITGLAIAEPEPEHIISTDKNEYTLGETVVINITPEIENKSIYIEEEEERHKLDDNTYLTEKTGEYQVIALIVLPNDILRLETSFTVINTNFNQTINATVKENMSEIIDNIINETLENIEESQVYEFSEICIETCDLPETNYPTLIVEVEENSKLTITKLIITQTKENSAPVQTNTIQDIFITTSQETTIELNQYFKDPDNDDIQYDINEIPKINVEIYQSALTISSNMPGIYLAYIYATDGDKLITSNTFYITVSQGLTEYSNTSNITVTQEGVEQATTPATEPITPEPSTTPTTQPSTTDPCTHPQLNKRPAYCFVGIEDQAFKELSAPIENMNGKLVGRFTRFGNLVIKGLLVQGTTGTPREDDFKIGFTERKDFEEITTHTAWIDDETGNLYLRGRVYEEQDILEPPQYNTYIIQNKYGIVLGYFDELTGDLYLKGNLVQLGKI